MQRLEAYIWLNIAQLQRIQKNDAFDMTAFTKALSHDPGNPHIRWQIGTALIQRGDIEAATATLLPLAQLPLYPQDANLLFSALIDSKLEAEMLELYELMDFTPDLTPRVASVLALQYLYQSGKIPPTRAKVLLAQAFNTTLTRYKPLEKQLVDTDSWSSSVAQHMRNALAWRSQKRVPESISLVSKPNRRSVSAMLKVAPADVNFGEELVVNGGFEQLRPGKDGPRIWRPSFMTRGNPWNRAAFIIGTDNKQPFAGNRSLRIDGLLIERLPEREPARAGFWYEPITVTTKVPYVISFVYRTGQTDSSKASLWLSDDPQVFFAHDRSFPPTKGRWNRVTIIAWNRSNTEASIKPLLRSFSEGSVWFDNFSIRPVVINPQLSVPPQKKPLIQIVSARR